MVRALQHITKTVHDWRTIHLQAFKTYLCIFLRIIGNVRIVVVGRNSVVERFVAYAVLQTFQDTIIGLALQQFLGSFTRVRVAVCVRDQVKIRPDRLAC